MLKTWLCAKLQGFAWFFLINLKMSNMHFNNFLVSIGIWCEICLFVTLVFIVVVVNDRIDDVHLMLQL